MKWESTILDNITKISKGKKHSETDDKSAFRYLQIEDLHGTGSNKYTTEKGIYCNESDLLIAWDGANAGKVGTGLNGMAGSTLARINITSTKVHSRFLYWFLSSKFEEIKSKRTGATIPHVNGSELRTMKVPLPPLPIQQQIADTLDKADALCQKDQELLDKYDELAQAVFYEMFGDPVRNEKKWMAKKLSDLSSHISSGSTPLGGQNVYIKEGVLFIRSQNVLMRKFDITDAAFISEDIHNKMKRTWVKTNDVLLNITGASIGRVATYKGPDDKANVNQHVCIIRTKPEYLTPDFLMYLLSNNSYQSHIIGKSAGGTRESFTFSQIKNFDVILPPILQQLKFTKIIESIKRQTELSSESIEKSSQFFFSLMNSYFRNELL